MLAPSSAFTDNGSLKRHVQGVHEGARPFQCTVAGCGKTFTTSGSLKAHVQGVHDGARPFKCTVEGCGKTFARSGSLQGHVRTLHGGQVTQLAGNIGTERAEWQIADPPIAVKIMDDQDRTGISAPALKRQIKDEREPSQDDARLHFFRRRLSGQDRRGARVACEFALKDGTLQHF